jgi:hypothetical protein
MLYSTLGLHSTASEKYKILMYNNELLKIYDKVFKMNAKVVWQM